MTNEKIAAFFNTAIDKTKAGILRWNRANYYYVREFEDVDEERTFYTVHGNGSIVIIRNNSEGDISCWVKPDPDLSYQRVGEYNDATLIRLYNVVYSKFPSVESFVDDFING